MPDHNKRHIAIFAIITALCLIGDSMLYIVLPVHYADVGLSSLWEVGVLLAVNRLVRLPLNPCLGWLYKHISEKTGILAAIFLAVSATLSYAFLDNFWLWIVARCVWGLAWGLLRLGSLFCIFKLSTPTNRGQLTGLYNGLYRLGSLVGMLFGGILADLIGIRNTAIFFALVSALAFLLAILHIPGGKGEGKNQDAGLGLYASLAAIAHDSKALWVVLTGGLVALALQGVLASTLSRLIEVHTGGTVSFFQWAIGAASLAGFFQALRWAWEPWLAPLTGKISDTRLGWRKMLFCACAGAALFSCLLALPLPLLVWFACILGMQLVATGLTTLTDAAAADAAASLHGRTVLVHYALIVDVGAALGPLAAYSLNAFLGIDAVYFFCALLYALLALVWQRKLKACP